MTIDRAIVRAPQVIRFDGPLSKLDAALRGQTRVETAKLHRERGATTIHLTHDPVQAMALAGRVALIDSLGSGTLVHAHVAQGRVLRDGISAV